MDLTCYTILVPIGSSEQSKIALEQAERMAVITENLYYLAVSKIFEY